MIRTCLKRNVFLIAFVLISVDLDFNLGTPVKLQNLPLKSDMDIFLDAIERRILKPCQIDKKKIDFNLFFGLVLLYVNLKHAIINKGPGVPDTLDKKLKRILDVDDGLLEHYYSTHPILSVLRWFINLDWFVNNLGRFDSHNHVVTFKSKEQLIQKYSPWSEYKKHVAGYSDRSNVPTPEQSDACLTSLAQNVMAKRKSDWSQKCAILQECPNIIANGTAFGYPMTHRLLPLMGARMIWGCYIISPAVDKEMTANFCTNMFDEAQYIAANDFEGADLMMEHVTLCSMFGHVEFLQRSWLHALLKRQTPVGCYASPRNPNTVDPKQEDPNSKKCEAHYTAVMAGTFGSAVRYVVETQY